METKYTESVGYRPNALRKTTRSKSGIVTVYAERTNNMSCLGEYGQDAYPVVYENTDGKNTYGMMISADGVENAAFLHPSLDTYLSEKIESFCADVKSDEAKLSLFLRTLYGEELFKPENKDALDYALKSFAPVPIDGFYVSDKFKWSANANAQKVMPFYKRESQWLGSRMVCVGLYLKFRKAFAGKNIGDVDEKFCEKLKKDIEEYIYGELKTNALTMISHDDAPTVDKKLRYFLATSVAIWFYVESNEKIRALSLNMGDTRCYVSDLEDGVRQISVDDVFSDGAMTAFVHFGTAPKTTEGYCDGTLRARVVELQLPCMLMACSDGVYDTCPEVKDKGGDTLGSSSAEPVDFLFEKNLLDAMRGCYSLDDFKREIVFNFYGHAATSKGISERRDGSYYTYVKRDDGGTLAAKFFGKTPTELFDGLRKNKQTTLDRIFDKVVELKNQGVIIPISAPHVESQEEEESNKYDECADKLFGNADFVNMLKTELYVPAFVDMKKAGGNKLWGITVTDEKPAVGYMLTKFFKQLPNKIAILKTAIADWKCLTDTLTFPTSWAIDCKHEHIIVGKNMLDVLRDGVEFKKIVEAIDSRKPAEASTELEKYESFYNCFMGEVGDRDKVDLVGSRGDEKTLDKYNKNAPPAEKKSPEQSIMDGEVKTRREEAEKEAERAREEAQRERERAQSETEKQREKAQRERERAQAEAEKQREAAQRERERAQAEAEKERERAQKEAERARENAQRERERRRALEELLRVIEKAKREDD